MYIDSDSSSDAALTGQAWQAVLDLREALNCSETSYEVLEEFHEQMADRKQESFVVLEIVGLGVITEAVAWWMDDQSILIVGWQDDETLAMGALAVGAELTPIPYYGSALHPLH